MLQIDIAPSDDAGRLLRNLDVLNNDALEVAGAAEQAPNPAISDFCHALRWIVPWMVPSKLLPS